MKGHLLSHELSVHLHIPPSLSMGSSGDPVDKSLIVEGCHCIKVVNQLPKVSEPDGEYTLQKLLSIAQRICMIGPTANLLQPDGLKDADQLDFYNSESNETLIPKCNLICCLSSLCYI